MPIDEQNEPTDEPVETSADPAEAPAEEPRPEGGPEGPSLAEELAPLVGEAMGAIFGVLRSGGRRVAKQGRGRLELYQSKRDLDRLYQKLGREVVRLVEAGEVEHPGLVTGAERVHRQQELIREIEAGQPAEPAQPEPESESEGAD